MARIGVSLVSVLKWREVSGSHSVEARRSPSEINSRVQASRNAEIWGLAAAQHSIASPVSIRSVMRIKRRQLIAEIDRILAAKRRRVKSA